MKSELLRKALMATYDKGGPIKKKKASSAAESKVTTQYVKDIPKDSAPALDASGNQMYDEKGRKMYKRSTMNEPDAGIGQPKKWEPKSTTTKGKGTYVKPKGGNEPYIVPTKKGTESVEYFVQDEPTTNEPKPVTPAMAFGYSGEVKESFGEDAGSVMINGKPTKLQTYLIPAQRDAKTGTYESNTGNMNPTKATGYVGADGNFVAIDRDYLGEGKYTFDKNKKMVYDPTTLKPFGFNGAGEQLRKEGAKIATNSNQEQIVTDVNAKLASKGLGPVKVTETISPVNFDKSGYSINKQVPLESVKQNLAPQKGINAPAINNPPDVNINAGENVLPVGDNINLLYRRKKNGLKNGGLVGKYNTGGPIKNPYIKYNDSSIYNQNSNKAIKDEVLGTENKILTDTAEQGTGTGLGSLAGPIGTVGTMVAGGIDAADRKDGRSSYGGQIAAGVVSGGAQGFSIGSKTGIPGAGLAGAAIGAVIGATKRVIGVDKEKAELRSATAGEVRANAQNSLTYNPDAPDTFKASNYDKRDYITGKSTRAKNDAKVMAGIRSFGDKIGFAKGGTIKGEGTGTSDSIETKVGGKGIPEGSFITPAKNNGLAKLIRRDVLGENPNKVAGFKKGGNADMAVSNGEHLFTPKEKAKVTAYLGKEILEELAPDAEDGEDKKMGGKVKCATGGDVKKGNTTKRMYSSGNPALDAEIDLLYKTGNWRKEAVDKIEAKAKALGLNTGEGIFDKRARTGVFKDLQYKSDYFNNEVNKELQSKKQQKDSEMKRFAVAPNAPKGLSDADKQTYLKLKKEVVVDGKDLAPLQKFVAAKKDSLEESNQFQSQLKRGIETGKEYANKYKLAQDLKAKLEYAKKNADKFTAEELQSAVEQEKKANLEYNKLKTPSQYANPNNKRLDAIYEEFAKKKYKPINAGTQVVPVQQQVVPIKQNIQPQTKPATKNWEWG